jgi:hypothetical protein
VSALIVPTSSREGSCLGCNPRHQETAELPAEKRGCSTEAISVRLDQIDEPCEGRQIAQGPALNPKWNSDQAAHARLAPISRDALANAEQRRQQAADTGDAPDSIQLGHAVDR